MTTAQHPKLLHRVDIEQTRFLGTARQVMEMIGAEFFVMLANKLCVALDAECVYVGEFANGKNERVQVISASEKADWAHAAEFPLRGTPEAQVALGHPCLFGRAVRDIFPEDHFLADLTVEAYVGVPLIDEEGQPSGVIAALFREPLGPEISFVQSMLNVFVARASAELNRKRTDDARRENEQRYRAFVELNPDACWRVEFDEPIDITLPEKEQLAQILRYGRVAECNDAWVKMLGRQRPDQLVGEPVAKAALDPENLERSLLTLIRSHYDQSTIEVTVTSGGTRRHFLHSQWAILDNTRLIRIWGSTRDVTELRELEAQFRHAQKLESIGRLTAGVAHDFNNLLTVITGYSSELLARAKTTDEAYAGLSEIVKAASKGTALTSQLLTFSRRQSGKFQLLDLNVVVSEDEPMLRRALGKHVELVTRLEQLPALVRADDGHLQQVLLNLAMNARDAMPNGGTLTVTVANVDIDENRPARLASITPGSWVQLSVSDTGTGMPPEVEEHLFEPFFTTKEAGRGTGLGLFTVYGIIRQIGGNIVVKTEPKKGATFDVFIPRATGT
jgi:PAS domain S-box-containing protein